MEAPASRHTGVLGSLPPLRFSVIAVACLCAFVLLASAVAHGNGPYGFEDPAFTWLGAPSTTVTWGHLSEYLATPLIGAALIVSVAIGAVRRGLPRVIVYAAFAVTAFLVSEHIAKPLVQRSYYEELTFPSGSVTAVTATALAMGLALYPMLGKRARILQALIGCVWILLTSLAVVGALWHTPLDDLGSILLSVGIVTGGAAILEYFAGHRARTQAGGVRMGRLRERAGRGS